MGHWLQALRDENTPKEELTEHPEILDATEELATKVRRARTWEDLSSALEDARQASEAATIPRHETEQLIHLVGERSRHVPAIAPGRRLSSLLTSWSPVVQVQSRILGEVVVWAADGVELPADCPHVAYRVSELRQLAGRTPMALRAIHSCKRAFDGELLAQ